MKSLSQWQPSWFLFPILTVRSSLLYISFLCLSSVHSATEINLLCISVICMRNCNILFVISLFAHNPDFFRIPFFIFADSWFGWLTEIFHPGIQSDRKDSTIPSVTNDTVEISVAESCADLFFRTCEFVILRFTWVNVLYQQILSSLQLPFCFDKLESFLIEVFFTGNIYPATCTDKIMWHCIHWYRPPILQFIVYRNL